MYEDLICKKCGNEIDDDVCETCLISLAQEASNCFETKQRHNTDEYYVCCKEGTPSWVREMIYEAHDDMLPDDYKYKFIRDAIDGVIENGLDEPYIEADVYNSDLMKWASSHYNRISYCDDAIKEGLADGVISAYMIGQEQEKREVFDIVLDYLKNKLNQLDTADVSSNI